MTTNQAPSAGGEAPGPAAAPAAPAAPGPPGSRTIGLARAWPLLAIATGGLALRWWHVLGARPACDDTRFEPGAGMPAPAPLDPPRCLRLHGDSLFNYMQGRMIGEGKGFGNGFAYLESGRVVPSAGKPPLYPLFLGIMYRLGLHSVDQMRLASCVLGAVGIVVLGLLAWRLAGRRAAVIAAGLAAVSPLLFIGDDRMMVEAIYVPLLASLVLAAYAMWRSPRPRTAIVLGVMVGATALARSEASLLLVLLVLPLVASIPRVSRKGRATLFALVAVTSAVVVFPWLLRNLTTFEEPTFLQFGSGGLLLNGNCDAAYYTDPEFFGFENFKCFDGETAGWLQELIDPDARDESEIDALMRERATAYIKDNAGRLPVIMLYREGRIWELYRPGQNIEVNYRFEDRGYPESVSATAFYFATMPFAAAGLVVLRRRRVPIVPFVAVLVSTTLTVAFAFGITRFRVGVDALAVVLAAIAIDALWRRAGARGGGAGGGGAGGVVDDLPEDLAEPRHLLRALVQRRPSPPSDGGG